MKTRLLIIIVIAVVLIISIMASNYYATKDLLPGIEQNSSDCWTTWHIIHEDNPYENGHISDSIRETISGFGVHVDDPFRNIKITKNTDGTFFVRVSGAWYGDEYDAITNTLDGIENISLANTNDVLGVACS